MIDLAHIHPMVVHFPIVLLLTGVVIDIASLARGQDLGARSGLPAVATGALVVAAASAVAAVIFGDIALDAALSKGFPAGPLERHEEVGFIVLGLLLALASMRALAMWQRFALTGLRGIFAALADLTGAAVIIVAAFYGGELVYQLGVNVAPVTP